MGKNVLPLADESGYYEVRLESIGGLGANLAGKMLAELGALYMGLNASSFSSYGSEKKGSPVRAFVRFMERDGQILRNVPVNRPHLLGVFHEAMARRFPVFDGIFEESVVVINTKRSAQEICDRYGLQGKDLNGRMFCFDAAGLARSLGCRLNMVMLGALTAASGFLDVEKLQALCTESLGKKYPAQLELNLSGIKGGYEAVCAIRNTADYKKSTSETVSDQKNPQLGKTSANPGDKLAESPAGCGLCAMEEPFSAFFPGVEGGVNPCPGNTAENDLSPGREGFRPAFHPEKCIHCGLCDTTCPDMVFRFEEEERNGKRMLINQGPVYQYCKGCLRCVEVCPVGALTTMEEQE